MFLENLNNLIYQIEYTKSYYFVDNEKNYTLIYNNTTSFISTNNKDNHNKTFIINYARLRIKHGLYQTILQNFPYLYEHALKNYSLSNNLILYLKKKEDIMLALCTQNSQRVSTNRLFGWQGYYFKNDQTKDNDSPSFFKKVFWWLRNKKKMTHIQHYNINLVDETYQNEKQQNKKKIKKINKLKPMLIFSFNK